jgi:hypothetical protein
VSGKKVDYQATLKEIETLIKKMDLPCYRKTVKHNKDARWLRNNLNVKNEKHKNYSKVIELLDKVL